MCEGRLSFHILTFMQTRRAALLTIAGAAVTPLLAQESGGQSFQPVFLKPSEYAVVTRLVDLILPRTDTPGAVDAQVPYRIDQEVAVSVASQAIFKTGLQYLADKDFVSLSEAQQVELLEAMCDATGSPQAQFFETVKGMTVDWYYRSEEGLVKELGFHGNTFRTEFTGCTHPEHWPQETKS